MSKETITVTANGVDFYCGRRGSGRPLVLVPDGVNGCGHYPQAVRLEGFAGFIRRTCKKYI